MSATRRAFRSGSGCRSSCRSLSRIVLAGAPPYLSLGLARSRWLPSAGCSHRSSHNATVMIASSVVAVAIGVSATLSPLLLLALVLLHGTTVSTDSGALTSGMRASAVPLAHRNGYRRK